MRKVRNGITVQVKIPGEVLNKIDQMAKTMNITRTDVIRKLLVNGTAFLIADSVGPSKVKSKVRVYDPAMDGWLGTARRI